MSLASFDLLTQCPAPASFPVLSNAAQLSRFSAAALLLLTSRVMRAGVSAATLPKESLVDPTSTWNFSLTPFESIMLGFTVLKLIILRFTDYTPILRAVFGPNAGMEGGGIKRRKRTIDPKLAKEKERLAETMFTVLRRLDMQDCLLRTLCELQVHSLHGHPLTRETKMTLSAITKSGQKRREKRSENADVLEERPVLSVFEEAVEVGWNGKGPHGTECEERYFVCPLSKKEILNHFDTIKVLNVL